MSRVSYYRVVGGNELALIQRENWTRFPALPEGVSAFRATSNLDDALELADVGKVDLRSIDLKDADASLQIYDGLPAEWEAWSNSAYPRHVVSFDLPEAWHSGSSALKADKSVVAKLNDDIIGQIQLVETFVEPSDGAGA